MLNYKPSDVPAAKTDIPAMEEGTYPAVISMIVDLGQQRNLKFDSRKVPEADRTDKDYQVQHKLWFSFAFPTERFELENDEGEITTHDQIKGKALTVSTDSRATLQQLYSAICKKGETYGEMLGMPVSITYGKNQAGNLGIIGISGPMKGTKVDAPLKPLVIVGEDSYDNLDDVEIPEFLKTMIKERV